MGVPELAHRLLVQRADQRGWRHLWKAAESRWGDRPVKTDLHGQPAVINFANPHPRFFRQFPYLNRPQVLAVQAAAEALHRQVHVVDVGAAMGDSALLLLAECQAQMASLTCVEGDPEFTKMLRANVGDRAIVYEAMLSNCEGSAPELVRAQHAGTASAVGDRRVASTTLDAILEAATVDVLKIDTDGYDGLVLAGGRRVLKQRPLVLFEWHPIACAAAGTDPRLSFRLLDDYLWFAWFTKYGVFSHLTRTVDDAVLDEMARVCRNADLPDWYYDVIAVPEDCSVSLTQLASTRGW